jgi:hypothetical protein
VIAFCDAMDDLISEYKKKNVLLDWPDIYRTFLENDKLKKEFYGLIDIYDITS